MSAAFALILIRHIGVAFALTAVTCHAWETKSRELVDVQLVEDDTLIILVSAPGASEPGLYRWARASAEPVLLCPLKSPASFSFDRKRVIERTTNESPALRIYDAIDCKAQGQIQVEHRAVDADARGDYVAAVVRLADRSRELRLYTLAGNLQARTAIGRNAEIGFAPDGESLVNFDLSEGQLTVWQMPTLLPYRLPAWVAAGETTFVPGASWVKRYLLGQLTLHRWPSGAVAFSSPLARSFRLHQTSSNGRYVVAHSFEASTAALSWLDLSTGRSVLIAQGDVDHATLNANGSFAAWAIRERGNVVKVKFAPINTNDCPTNAVCVLSENTP